MEDVIHNDELREESPKQSHMNEVTERGEHIRVG